MSSNCLTPIESKLPLTSSVSVPVSGNLLNSGRTQPKSAGHTGLSMSTRECCPDSRAAAIFSNPSNCNFISAGLISVFGNLSTKPLNEIDFLVICALPANFSTCNPPERLNERRRRSIVKSSLMSRGRFMSALRSSRRRWEKSVRVVSAETGIHSLSKDARLLLITTLRRHRSNFVGGLLGSFGRKASMMN